jgi:glutaredoxin
VELDEHPIGASLQAKLAEMTGRQTVPNVLVNGKSIGGGDDIVELDKTKTLINKLRNMGGKRMQEVRLKSG